LEKTGRISLAGFYERRIARIFPAFYTYLSVLLILMLTHVIDLHWQELATAATYTWNYGWYWYHPSKTAGEVLGQLWTLSLEEQFYIFWPACLILVGKRWAERIAIGCVVLFPFVRIASYFAFPVARGQLTMMFHTGSDQILWGAVAAFACQRGALSWFRNFKYRAAIPWLCAFAVFVIRPVLQSNARSLSVPIIPTMECISVVLFVFWVLSGEGGLLRRILESWPLVQLGLLSYSLYLWQSVFILWDGIGRIWLPLRLLGALVVAIFSYRFIEVPFRSRIRKWFAQSQPAH
jgi:peptidoglycan/LPS O-acetylase OafA/YrhL